MVIIFNVTSSNLSLLVNYNPSLAPRPMTPGTYIPNRTAVPIKKFVEGANFTLGKNVLTATFQTNTSRLKGPFTYGVDLPGSSISENYVCFLFANSLCLMRSSGELIKFEEQSIVEEKI